MGFISSLFGGGKTPTVQSAPAVQKVAVASEDTAAEEQRLKRARSQLFNTTAGVLGEELSAGSTSSRSTLFGN